MSHRHGRRLQLALRQRAGEERVRPERQGTEPLSREERPRSAVLFVVMEGRRLAPSEDREVRPYPRRELSMSPQAMSPLRRRMIEDRTIRQFGEKTKRDYIRQVREFTAFLGRSPDRAEPEDLRRYQLHLASLGASYARMNLAGTALRFFFHVTLGRPGFGDRMARIASPERLPVVLSPEEVAL